MAKFNLPDIPTLNQEVQIGSRKLKFDGRRWRAVQNVIEKDDIGLTNVLNEEQATKSDFDAHVGNQSNPHSVNKTHVGLSNVDNTADANKYVKGMVDTNTNTNMVIWTGTQAQYDAIVTKDANTIYLIEE